jgi:hypothetical protein
MRAVLVQMARGLVVAGAFDTHPGCRYFEHIGSSPFTKLVLFVHGTIFALFFANDS